MSTYATIYRKNPKIWTHRKFAVITFKFEQGHLGGFIIGCSYFPLCEDKTINVFLIDYIVHVPQTEVQQVNKGDWYWGRQKSQYSSTCRCGHLF